MNLFNHLSLHRSAAGCGLLSRSRVLVPRLLVAMMLMLLVRESAGQVPGVRWSNDHTRAWFRMEDEASARPSRINRFFLIDIAAKSTEPAFDHLAVQQQYRDIVARGATKKDAEQVESKNAVDLKNGKQVPVEKIRFSRRDNKDEIFLYIQDDCYSYDRKTKTLRESKRELDVELERRLFLPPRRSVQGQPTTLKIENRTDKPFTCFWVSREGRKTRFQDVGPNAVVDQSTFVGHVWLLRREGTDLGCFTARKNDHVIITSEVLSEVDVREPPIDVGLPVRRTSNEQWKVQVRDDNLWLSPKESSESIQQAFPLTRDVRDQFTFQNLGSGTFWNRSAQNARNRGDYRWSPDGGHLVAFMMKRGTPEMLNLVESSPAGQLQPKLKTVQYPKPGADLPTKTLRLFDVEEKQEHLVSDTLFENPYSNRFLGWSKSGDRFWMLYNQRGHQVLRLLEITVADGAVRTVVEEKSDTFIHYSDPGKSVREFVSDDELVWASERSGWNHLYRIKLSTGEVLNPITSGNWNVKKIEQIDRRKRVIFFYAVGVHADQDPYHEHYCRVNFDGTEFKILTDGDGTHTIRKTAAPDHFVDEYSRVDLATVVELRSLKTGELISELSRGNTQAEFSKTNRQRPLTERFVTKGRDGKTDIWGIIHRPRDFDPQKVYPVVENIYAGPHDFHVPKSFRTRYSHQHRIADEGMIVVQIDGMGTAWRSKAFHDVCYKNLRDAGFPDRIAWLKAAAKKYPEMDLSRVGIYGGSAGGQSAMAALLWHNDFYHVAVADCGCHDNRMDKIWWNEQWMGWPVDKSYVENSNMENAKLLEGHLMLTVGELDQNVDPATSLQVAKQLIRYKKDFEFVLVPGAGHGAGERPWPAKKRLDFLKRHLKVGQPVDASE